MKNKTEKQKMLAGEHYDAMDEELVAGRERARRLFNQINGLVPHTDEAELRALIHDLFGYDTDVQLSPPFYCDYGSNIKLGEQVYFNFNCVILDVCEVRIGDRVMFGPAVQIYTALHPMNVEGRRTGLEYGKPVLIGDDVWVGGGAILCPGVRVGAGTVIGAGAVVTRDLPPGVFAAGNPCRVIRNLQQTITC